MTQLDKLPTLDLGSDHDLITMSSNPSQSLCWAQSLLKIVSLTLPLSLPCSLSLTLSLTLKNKFPISQCVTSYIYLLTLSWCFASICGIQFNCNLIFTVNCSLWDFSMPWIVQTLSTFIILMLSIYGFQCL